MNPYEELNVTVDTDKAAIKKAYKSASSKVHPDKQGGDKEKFQRVKLAYDILSDPERKARYDQTGDIEEVKPKQDPVEQRITQLFASMIGESNFSGNVIEKAIDISRSAISDLVAASCKVDTELKKLTKRLGRVTCKDDLNMYEIVLNGKISELTYRMNQMDEEHAVMEGVLEKLSSYSDEAPEEEENKWPSHQWPNSL